MLRFEGKNVIVTGAARGIGRAILAQFLAEGAYVIAADIDASGIATTHAESADPDRVETAVVDMGDPLAARELVDGGLARLGRLHVLVNNAGVMPDGPALDITLEEWERTMAVNVTGPFIASQAAARHMSGAGGGSIVNVASTNAFRVESPAAHYNTSKAALVMMTRCLAHELGHTGVRANCVAPGETITNEERLEMDAGDADGLMDYLRRVPMRRPGTGAEQARAVLFLASDDASFITGETLVVDGGELTGAWMDEGSAPAATDPWGAGPP